MRLRKLTDTSQIIVLSFAFLNEIPQLRGQDLSCHVTATLPFYSKDCVVLRWRYLSETLEVASLKRSSSSEVLPASVLERLELTPPSRKYNKSHNTRPYYTLSYHTHSISYYSSTITKALHPYLTRNPPTRWEQRYLATSDFWRSSRRARRVSELVSTLSLHLPY